MEAQYTARIQELCNYIQANAGSGEPLTLKHLSERSGLSPLYLQRSFKAFTGVTPRQYIEGYRIKALKERLRANSPVTDAIYDAGFNSISRVYEKVDRQLGMTPAQYRAKGERISISYAITQSVLGLMMIAATDRGLCFLQFGDSKEQLVENLENEFPRAELQPMGRPYPEQFTLWMDALHRYLEDGQPSLNLPLDIRSTAFQLKVWNYLQTIPRGETRTYAEVAKAIGEPKAARAVARACATNPVPIVIPCHRVIRGDGGLSGYRWGVERKQALLEREKTA